MKRYTGSSERTRVVRPRRRCVAALVLAALAVTAPLVAQAKDEACDASHGSIGINGMSCEGCSFKMGKNGIVEARFRTEPVVLSVLPGVARGDALRRGDRIVSINGALISTGAGGGRLVHLRPGATVVVRVRRDGDVADLHMIAGSGCDEFRARASSPPLPPIGSVIEPAPLPPLPEPAARAEPAPLAAPAVPPRQPSAEPSAAPSVAPHATPAPLPRRAGARAPRSVVVGAARLPPAAYLGFGLSCSACGVASGEWSFSAPPAVAGVAPGSPAASAGILPGDELLRLDGLPLTSPRGARRFSSIEPGDTLRWSVRRAGRVSEHRFVASAPRDPAPAASASPALDASVLRFRGRIGDTDVEVRGGPVTVTRDEATGEVVIRTAASVIRLRPAH